jgi:hypothetical protein
MRQATMVLVNLAALAVAAPASAQPAKEGKVDATLCWGGPTHLINATPTERFGTYVVTGAVRADNGPLDSMSVECIGAFELRGALYQHKGYCMYQDPAGDKVYATDASTPQGYTWQFLGGTGKFEGIAGSGTVERLGNMSYVRQGTVQGCRRVLGTYRLP